jgi:hypothetical protein
MQQEQPLGRPGDMVLIERLEECFLKDTLEVSLLSQVFTQDCQYTVKSVNHRID